MTSNIKIEKGFILLEMGIKGDKLAVGPCEAG